MAEYLSPGVYAEEPDSGGKPMEGVGTSTAGFIGVAERGPVEGLPRLVTNFEDFKRIYGGYLPADKYGDYRFLAYGVEHFFINGGAGAFIARVAPQDAVCARGAAPAGDNPVLKLTAKNPGLWGNNLRAVLSPASKAKTQIYEVHKTSGGISYSVKNGAGFFPGDIVAFADGNQVVYNLLVKCKDNIMTFEAPFEGNVTDKSLLPERFIATCEFNLEIRYEDQIESYDNLSLNIEAPNYIEKQLAKSELVNAEYAGSEPDAPAAPFARLAPGNAAAASVDFAGGDNGNALTAADFTGVDNGAGKRTGIQAFVDNDVVSVIAVPGVTEPNVQLALTAHCESLASRFAVLDVPRDLRKVQDIMDYRNIFDSTYAALYHPWLIVFDPLDKRTAAIPPSGSIMGIYARSDNTHGVNKAPANEVVRSCVGLDVQFDRGEQDILSSGGVNLIRAFPGLGIRVWGARTAGSDGSWKYVNVRRMFIFIEETIKVNTKWVVSEANDEVLWMRVKRSIDVFLTNLWKDGFLAGSSPDEAFFVNIGHSTMSRDDIDNGRLICVIGAAPMKPAEFVIFRITQKTRNAQQL